jgi:hypothetical protein
MTIIIIYIIDVMELPKLKLRMFCTKMLDLFVLKAFGCFHHVGAVRDPNLFTKKFRPKIYKKKKVYICCI